MAKPKRAVTIPIAIGASFFAGLVSAALPEQSRIALAAVTGGALIVVASL